MNPTNLQALAATLSRAVSRPVTKQGGWEEDTDAEIAFGNVTVQVGFGYAVVNRWCFTPGLAMQQGAMRCSVPDIIYDLHRAIRLDDAERDVWATYGMLAYLLDAETAAAMRAEANDATRALEDGEVHHEGCPLRSFVEGNEAMEAVIE